MPSFAPNRLSCRLDLLSRARVQVRQSALPAPLALPRTAPRQLEIEPHATAMPTTDLKGHVLDALGIVITIAGFFLALLWI